MASEEKARKEFLELEKQKMKMEKEQVRNEEKREERFLCIMHETILMMRHPAPVPPPVPQPQQGSHMYHFDVPPLTQSLQMTIIRYRIAGNFGRCNFL